MNRFTLLTTAATISLASLVTRQAVFAEPAATQATTQPAKVPLSQRGPVVNPLPEPRSLEELKAAPLYTFKEKEVDIYLKYLSQADPDPISKLVHLARQTIGEPYEIYLLGEGPLELYDPDPMYCLNKSDCVTFVERTYAMALSHDWPSFFKTLQRIRYKDGKVGMLTRNHETVADWDKNNSWLFDDVTKSLGEGNQSAPLRMTWKPSKFFAKFGIGQDMPDVKIVDAYIPRDNMKNILKDLREGDMVHIVRGDPAGEQWVGHVGLVVFGEDKEVHFLHSAEPNVREQPIMDYLEKSTKTIGMKFLRPRQQLQQLVDAQMK